MKTFTIMKRNRMLINTDPQRRCYDGCHFSSELVWGDWELLQSNIPEDKIESRLKFWRELNDYAVSQRGAEAKTEYKSVEQTTGESK